MDSEEICDPSFFAVGAMQGDDFLSMKKLAATHYADEESLAWSWVFEKEVDLGGIEIG